MVSFAYPEVPSGVRSDLMARLGRNHRRDGEPAFILSTCLRVEVAVAGDETVLDHVLRRLLGLVPPGGERLTDAQAVHHLFRIASGLESAVVGEQEVWTQFRQAISGSRDSLDGRFQKLLEQAVATGRAARQILPVVPHGSLASVAAALLVGVERVAILGSGLMAKAAVGALHRLPDRPAVTVIARSPERVALDDVAVWGFDRAMEAVSVFPAVISATSAKHRLIDDQDLVKALSRRQTALKLIDLAMPPDFDPPAEELAEYVAIDALAGMVEERVDVREAGRLVAEAAEDGWRKYAVHGDLSPAIARLYATADEVVARTVERFANRLSDSADLEILRQTAHTVARTLMSGPVSRLHRPDAGPDLARALADAFATGDSDA